MSLYANGSYLIYMRSIPACAGEPLGMKGFGYPPGVYPRVCGEIAHCRYHHFATTYHRLIPPVYEAMKG